MIKFWQLCESKNSVIDLLESGLAYQSPPSIDPFSVEFDIFNDKLLNSQRALGAALTIDCNVGGDISTLICNNLN